MAKQEVDDEPGTVTTMRSMRTTLSKPYDEDKVVTETSNSLKLSLQESRGGRNQKPHIGQAVSFKSRLSTNSCRGNLTVHNESLRTKKGN